MPDGGAGDTEVGGQLALGRQACPGTAAVPLGFGEDQLGQARLRRLLSHQPIQPIGPADHPSGGASGDECAGITLLTLTFLQPMINQSVTFQPINPLSQPIWSEEISSVRLATIITTTGPRLHVRARSGYVDVGAATGNPRYASVQSFLTGGAAALDAARALPSGDGPIGRA